MALTKVLRGGLSTGISDSSDATAITIDSSENVMINTSNTNPAESNVAGVSLMATNAISACDDGSAPIQLNRKSDNGSIAIFRKDGTGVGQIGVNSNDQFYMSRSTGQQGFKFKNSGLIPANTDGSDSDNDQDLGISSVRWKDLYLSGGVRVGGTGSANLLDDYEEGTFTPALTNSADNLGAGYASRAGFYTKTGNSVHFVIHITLNAYTSSSNQVYVTGLPFTSKNVSNCDHYFLVSGGHLNVDSNYLYVAATLGPNTTQLTPLMIGDSVSRENFRSHDITATNAEFFITGNYLT